MHHSTLRKFASAWIFAAVLLTPRLIQADTIVAPTATYRWLNPLDATDPAVNDPDFHTTWFTAGFDDSTWGTGTTSFGYGAIDGITPTAPVTDIGLPPAGSRYTAYFRTSFTAGQQFKSLLQDLLADDAAFVYIDGVLVYKSPALTVPDTYTAIAPGAGSESTIIVSPLGNDTAVGNAEKPLRTISAAAALAQPGDTILVKAGIYRERVAPPRSGEPGKPITYRGEKLGSVFIRGSEEWKPAWQPHAGKVVFAVPENDLFNDDVYMDSASPFMAELASTPYGRDGKPEVERKIGTPDPNMVYTCGQVIVNGKPWEQRPFLTEVETRPSTWTFAADSGRIYVNFGDLSP